MWEVRLAERAAADRKALITRQWLLVNGGVPVGVGRGQRRLTDYGFTVGGPKTSIGLASGKAATQRDQAVVTSVSKAKESCGTDECGAKEVAGTNAVAGVPGRPVVSASAVAGMVAGTSAVAGGLVDWQPVLVR